MSSKEYAYCRRCSRPLKTPSSRRQGYGPVCYKKINEKPNKPLFLFTNDKEVLYNKQGGQVDEGND